MMRVLEDSRERERVNGDGWSLYVFENENESAKMGGHGGGGQPYNGPPSTLHNFFYKNLSPID